MIFRKTILTSFRKITSDRGSRLWPDLRVSDTKWSPSTTHTPPTVITGPDLSPLLHSPGHFPRLVLWITFYRNSLNTRTWTFTHILLLALNIQRKPWKMHIYPLECIDSGRQKEKWIMKNLNLFSLSLGCNHSFFSFTQVTINSSKHMYIWSIYKFITLQS